MRCPAAPRPVLWLEPAERRIGPRRPVVSAPPPALASANSDSCPRRFDGFFCYGNVDEFTDPVDARCQCLAFTEVAFGIAGVAHSPGRASGDDISGLQGEDRGDVAHEFDGG